MILHLAAPLHILLDVSRLLSVAGAATPSGIDRVEAAYVARWLDADPARCTFVAYSPWGYFTALPRGAVARLHAALAEVWAGGDRGDEMRAVARRIRRSCIAWLCAGRGRDRLEKALAGPERCAFLLVSHKAMEKQEPIARLRRAGALFVPLVHDLIPATHPEYARPGVTQQHLRRLATVSALADGIIVNSTATADALRPHLVRRDGPPPVRVAVLGVTLPEVSAETSEPPYFIAVGTIEPRKNHLLLLHLWRDLAERYGPATPRLRLIGKRGWENENVLDLLERCTVLRGLVTETGNLTDRHVAGLLRGARALLFPSFAEGYGLPLAEALALGTPAICSNIPALREVGGNVPEYLDPLDGAAWRQRVLDFARPDSRARETQLKRLALWRRPLWEDHFAEVDGLLDELTGGRTARPRLEAMTRRTVAEPVALTAAACDAVLG
ncbi:MAG: glycosyltransferase family 1 protein [Rhodospirillales bacterium]|jgi:glycosyltransferase involved in cell wall biosynthesis|nr:glycosyltransferase family 1 protein [Rhodospirillales bacterium]MDB5382284.1 glycosyltransferase family 1 protein [Rhodospirillales bacterium]